MKKAQKYLILENIRSVHNVGAIFRTADAVGIDKLILVGQTPTPVDRFGRARKDLAKVALGAEKNIEWEYFKNEDCLKLIKKLKGQSVTIISVEQDEKSEDYRQVAKKILPDLKNEKNRKKEVPKIALIFGNEVEGVSKPLLQESDHIAEIPMRGKKESLNVSVSAGIVMFEIFNQLDAFKETSERKEINEILDASNRAAKGEVFGGDIDELIK